MKTMKLSIAVGSVFGHYGDEFDFYRRIKAAGFNYVDMDFFDTIGYPTSHYMLPDWEYQIDQVGNEMAKIGISPCICHNPGGEPATDREGIVIRTKRALQCADKLGIKDMVMHPGGMDGWTKQQSDDFNLGYIHDLLPYAEKFGIRLLIENVGFWCQPYYAQAASEVRDMVELVNHPLVNACLDTGHLAAQDDDNPKAVRLLGKYLKGLHIADNVGSMPIPVTDRCWRADMHLAPGLTTVDFDGVVDALVDIGYEGPFNLEIETFRAASKQLIGCPAPRLEYVSADLLHEGLCIIHDSAVELLAAHGITAI